MARILKTITVGSLTDYTGNCFYVTKSMLKTIRNEVGQGYIHVIDNKDAKNNEEVLEDRGNDFKWPSTDIIGTNAESVNDYGLNEESAL